MEIDQITNEVLVSKLEELRSRERKIESELLAYLSELDKRKLYLELGYSSLFDFAVRRLGYSESGASRRIRAARCISENPELAQMYEQGEVSLGVVSTVAGVLKNKDTQERSELAKKVAGVSLREAEKLVAKEAPKKVIRERVKPVYVEATTSAGCTERYEIKFSVSAECREKLERAEELLSNKSASGGEIEKVFEALLDDFLERKSPEAKERRRAKRTSLTKESKPSGRHIPAATRDQVFLRDSGQCCFVSDDGVRCSARKYLQVDHIVPFAHGGSSQLSNLRLMCSAHNRQLAKWSFGSPVIERHYKR